MVWLRHVFPPFAAILLAGCYVSIGVDGVEVDGIQFVQQPRSQTVAVGQSASFAVSVAGTGPFTYQWLRDGTAIAGATDPGYRTPPTVPADDGARFAVRVCNDVFCVRSDDAVLNVVP